MMIALLLARLSLLLEHVDHAVDGAEGAGSAAAGAAVHDYGAFARLGGFVGVLLVEITAGLMAADDVVAMLDESEDLCWMCRGAEVGPGGELDLGEFADG